MSPTPGDGRAAANASAVLLAVLAHGPVARSGIPTLCGLSPAAVSRQTTALLRAGLLRELHELAEPPSPAGERGPGHSGTPDGTRAPGWASIPGGPGIPGNPSDPGSPGTTGSTSTTGDQYDPGVPGNPSDPADSSGPAGSDNPGDPRSPIGSDSPGVSGDPHSPGVSGGPRSPSDPSGPRSPGNPRDLGAPRSPGDPGDPLSPLSPGVPGNPGDPLSSGNPSDPLSPGDPVGPADPLSPGGPRSTSSPDNAPASRDQGATGSRATTARRDDQGSTATSGTSGTPGTPAESDTPQAPRPPGGPGRPRIPLDLHTGPVGGPLVAGLHIGVPASTFSLVDLRGRVLARRAFPHAGHSPGRLPAAIATELDGFLHEFRSGGTRGTRAPGSATRPLLGLGAALGGWVRPADGTVVRHDALGWHDLPLAALLSDRLGLPVSVDNHARAVAHAEILFGRPEARSSLLHLFIGNVVDAAFGIEGTVHQGPGAAAGDVAHLPVPGSQTPCACGRTGCLQASASDTVLGAEAVRRGIVPEPSVNLLVDAAATGDPRADRLLRERARTVGRAAALLLDVFNPAVMVVSELSSVLDDGYLDEIRGAAGDPERYGRRIVAPHAGPAVLPVAAATVLLGPLFRDPSRLT